MKPTVTVKPSQKPNPHTATGVCGSGYKVVNSRPLGGAATVYLLYNTAQAKNCVVTMSRYVFPSKIAMNATLQVKGGSHGSPSWKSGWSHCG